MRLLRTHGSGALTILSGPSRLTRVRGNSSHPLGSAVRAMRTFYEAELHDTVPADRLPNALLIAKEGNLEELVKALSLLLSCAVQCERKETFVSRILQMDDSLQKVLMHTIEQMQRTGESECALEGAFELWRLCALTFAPVRAQSGPDARPRAR